MYCDSTSILHVVCYFSVVISVHYCISLINQNPKYTKEVNFIINIKPSSWLDSIELTVTNVEMLFL